VFKSYSMKNKFNMLFSLIIDVGLFKKYFKGILIYLFFETTAHLAMQLHCDSQNSITQFRIEKCHVINS